MRLACAVSFEVDRELLGTKRLKVALKYAPIATPHYELYTAPSFFDASSAEWSVDVFRLRAGTDYYVEVVGELVEDVGTTTGKDVFSLAHGNFTSPTTGWSAFDGGPLASVSGAPPSFGVMFMDLEFVTKEFRGLVALDSGGYVVWYHNRKSSVQGFDQFPNYEVVIQSVEEGAPSGWSELATFSAHG
jgi:hypothetical protein